MTIIFLLIGISLLVALTFLAGFIWAVRSGQYDDDYTPSVRMLFDDEPNDAIRSGRTAAPSDRGQRRLTSINLNHDLHHTTGRRGRGPLKE